MTDREEAYERLERAIREVAALNEFEGLVTDWIVVAAVQQFGENGEDLTTVARLMPDGRIPWYRVMGLIDVAHAGMHNEVVDAADADDAEGG